MHFWRYYGLKPKLDDAYIRIKELERENDFLKWSKVLRDNNSEKNTNDQIKKIFIDVVTQTQEILHIDKVCIFFKLLFLILLYICIIVYIF